MKPIRHLWNKIFTKNTKLETPPPAQQASPVKRQVRQVVRKTATPQRERRRRSHTSKTFGRKVGRRPRRNRVCRHAEGHVLNILEMSGASPTSLDELMQAVDEMRVPSRRRAKILLRHLAAQGKVAAKLGLFVTSSNLTPSTFDGIMSELAEAA